MNQVNTELKIVILESQEIRIRSQGMKNPVNPKSAVSKFHNRALLTLDS